MKSMKQSRYIRLLACAVILISLAAALTVSASCASPEDSQIDNFIAGYPSETALRDMFHTHVTGLVNAWCQGTASYKDTVNSLKHLESMNVPYLSDYAGAQLSYVMIEEECNLLLSTALDQIVLAQYPSVFAALNSIDSSYSNYSEVEALYRTCTNLVLESTSSPSTAEEFLSAISLINSCLKQHQDPALHTRSNSLAAEFEVFNDISDTIDQSITLFNNQQVSDALSLLSIAHEQYPSDERLASTIVDLHTSFILNATLDANTLCEQGEYKLALAVLDDAIAEYDCEDLHILREYVREQKSPLYAFKNDVADKLSYIGNLVCNNTNLANVPTYLLNSGEKFILGDFSDAPTTVLSLSANLAASILNVDILLDLRDIYYDLSHWGEDDYFIVWLAVDVVALIPVIGFIKHLDSLGDAAKVCDNIADVGDGAKAVKLVATTTEVAKQSSSVIDAANEISKSLSKGYEFVQTINWKLLGSAHDDTGIKYVAKQLDFSDGRKLVGVFPQFESFADVRLPEDLYGAIFKEQQDYCMEQLQKQTRSIFGRYRKNFTDEQLADIANGILPDGFTWHHNEEEGLMQLVETVVHSATGHTGGMSLWGRGYN